jgi:hypothetical protein
MIIVGIILNIVGLGVFCWALFSLAIHALPFFIGTTAAMYIYQTGAGPFSAVAIGFVVGSFTFVLGQYAFSAARSRMVHFAIGLLFSVPAAAAGYHLTWALSHIGAIPTESWQDAFALIGGFVVGGTAWARLSILNELRPGSVQPSIEAMTRGR